MHAEDGIHVHGAVGESVQDEVRLRNGVRVHGAEVRLDEHEGLHGSTGGGVYVLGEGDGLPTGGGAG